MRCVSLPLLVSVVLLGCAGTGVHYTGLLNSGNLTVDEVNPAAGTYRVSVMNTTDFGWDGGDRADREKAIAHVFADKCARTEILSDNPLQIGTYTFTTKPRVKHSMVVRCTPRV